MIVCGDWRSWLELVIVRGGGVLLVTALTVLGSRLRRGLVQTFRSGGATHGWSGESDRRCEILRLKLIDEGVDAKPAGGRGFASSDGWWQGAFGAQFSWWGVASLAARKERLLFLAERWV